MRHRCEPSGCHGPFDFRWRLPADRRRAIRSQVQSVWQWKTAAEIPYEWEFHGDFMGISWGLIGISWRVQEKFRVISWWSLGISWGVHGNNYDSLLIHPLNLGWVSFVGFLSWDTPMGNHGNKRLNFLLVGSSKWLSVTVLRWCYSKIVQVYWLTGIHVWRNSSRARPRKAMFYQVWPPEPRPT